MYPTITLLLLAVAHWLVKDCPLWQATIFLTGIVSVLTHFLLSPLVSLLLQRWVFLPSFRGLGQGSDLRACFIFWAMTYPLVTLILAVTLHFLGGKAPLAVITLIVTAIAMPLQSLVMAPRIIPLAMPWIRSPSAAAIA